MNAVETVASHRLTFNGQDEVVDADTGLLFDTDSYSSMKYGNREVTRRFARELTGHVLEVRPELLEDESAPVFLVPFSVVPPTPFHLSRYTLETINEERIANGYEPGTVLRIDKSRTQTTNYAAMSVEEREAEVGSIDFWFADDDGSPSAETQAVILDDLRVTGTVMNRLLGLLEDHDPARTTLGFVAMFNPRQALQHPEVEDRINGTDAKSVDDILPLILNDNFDLTIRTLKMILSTDEDRLTSFLGSCPPSFVERILEDTVRSGADFVDYHKLGYRCLEGVAREIT